MTIFHGAWPALITPATPEDGVDTGRLRELVDYLLAKGVGGFYVCGSTGEGLYQSVSERILVTETVLDQARDRVPIIVHVGCLATRDARTLARHAQDVGTAGVSSVLPQGSVSLHYHAIALAAPGLPFFPYMVGGQSDALALMCGLLEQIPNLGGGKYTGPNMYELHHLVTLRSDDWTIFSGMDEQCVLAAMFGATANIGSTLNLMPGVYRQIWASYEQGNLAHARDLQLRANRVTSTLIAYGFSGALREAMRLLGLNCGQPRPPISALPLEKREQFHDALQDADFAELTSM